MQKLLKEDEVSDSGMSSYRRLRGNTSETPAEHADTAYNGNSNHVLFQSVQEKEGVRVLTRGQIIVIYAQSGLCGLPEDFKKFNEESPGPH